MNRPLALVTGASGGLGAALARSLAREGYDLVLTARRTHLLDALAAELSAHAATASVLECDLALPGAANALMAALATRGLDRLDALVNNAGLGEFGHFAKVDFDRLRDTIAVNIAALTELTHLVLPGMLTRRRGFILLVASTATFQPGPGLAAYSATKAYSFFEAANASTVLLNKRVLSMGADRVASQSNRAMMRGQAVFVPGIANKAMDIAGRHLPRLVTLPILRRLLSA